MALSALLPHEMPETGAAAEFAETLRSHLPRLQTERLTLRAPRLEDFPVYAEILMSNRAGHMDGPFDREEAWLDFTSSLSNWLLRGYGPWTILPHDETRIIGFVSVQMEFGDHEPELGYFLTKEAEGQGFGVEAATAARDHALKTLRLKNLVSYIGPENDRSIALAQKLGAAPDPVAAAAFPDHATDPVLVYRHAPLATSTPAHRPGGRHAGMKDAVTPRQMEDRS